MHRFACVYVGCHIHNALRWTMCDRNINIVWNGLPDHIQLRSSFHVGPVIELWCVGRSQNPQSVKRHRFMNQEGDLRIVACANQSPFNGRGMIPRNEDPCGNRRRGVSLKESSGFHLIHPRISMCRFITAVDHGIHCGNHETVMFAMRI